MKMRTHNDARCKGRHTLVDIARIMINQDGKCAYCHAGSGLQLDHKTPRARGGTNDPDNMQWVCRRHNAEKHAFTDEEFRQRLNLKPGARLPDTGIGKGGGRPVDLQRLEARKQGDKTFQGRDCRKGHGGMRFTSNGACVECTAEGQRKRRGTIHHMFG